MPGASQVDLETKLSVLSMISFMYDLAAWQTNNVTYSCKATRDYSRRLCAHRSKWFDTLMDSLGKLNWTDKPGREWVKTFMKKWYPEPRCKIQRQIQFSRNPKLEPVTVEIKDTVEEQLTVAQRQVTKACTNVVKVHLLHSMFGKTIMKFESNRCTTTLSATDRVKKVTGEYISDDIEEYQGVPLRTWQDLRALMFSKEFLTKPFDKSLVIRPRI